MEYFELFKQLISGSKEFMKLLFIPVISATVAVIVGEYLRNRNYKKQQKDDLLRRIIHYGYQLSPTYSGNKNDILGALNEIKFWYFDNDKVKNLTLGTIDTMSNGKDAQNILLELLQKIAEEEGKYLSKQDIEKLFSTK